MIYLKIKNICFLVLICGKISVSLPASDDHILPCTEIFSYQSESGKRDGVLNLPENLKNKKLYKLQVEFFIPVKLQTVRLDS